MIEVLYCTHNRLAFTQKTLPLLLNTIDERIARVWVYDDASIDGTREYVAAACNGHNACSVSRQFGGPVVSMAHFLETTNYPELFAKIDSDVALPPFWFETCLEVMKANPTLDLLGIEPMDEDPMREVGCDPFLKYAYRKVEHIGGIGLMRGAPFRKYGLPAPQRRFFGFTKWQTSHDDVIKGWLVPALTVALLDRIPEEPWYSLAAEYCRRGWARPWPLYSTTTRVEQWKWVTS